MPLLPDAIKRARASEPIIPSLPRVIWLSDSDGTAFYHDDVLTVRARARTDWYSDGAARNATAPALVFPLDDDCALTARVSVDFAADFDAGFLLVHQSATEYAKLGFEQTPGGSWGRRGIVSVVTRGVSDEASGPRAEGKHVLLRVSRAGGLIAFHCSVDQRVWQLVRMFSFWDPARPTSVGFAAQSPVGRGVTARFDCVAYRVGTPAGAREVGVVEELHPNV